MGAEIIVPLLLTAASAGVSAYNTNKTAKKQDAVLADSIRNQKELQRQQDARVNEEVGNLSNSTMEESRAKRMDQFMQQLGRNRQVATAGLTQNVGGDAFQSDAAAAAESVVAEGNDTAGLLARIDAPEMQRQGEAKGFGHLATDTDLLRRRSQGQQFLDELRLKKIRRNPWLDVVSAGLSGASGMGFGGSGVGGTSAFTPVAQGGNAVYRALGPNSGYGMA
jgi:hypothetical protein